ncbi:MAG: zinc ribbon domain-containing protein [archaeon]|nr:zinc ribbon domain-containing protein [archaeon]
MSNYDDSVEISEVASTWYLFFATSALFLFFGYIFQWPFWIWVPIGITFIYALIETKKTLKKKKKKCPKCKSPLKKNTEICKECNTRILTKCQFCGAKIKDKSPFCSKCGENLLNQQQSQQTQDSYKTNQEQINVRSQFSSFPKGAISSSNGRFCSVCGSKAKTGESICSVCGSRL